MAPRATGLQRRVVAVAATLTWHTRQVLGLAWAGPVLVSGDTAGHVALWDVGDLVEAR